MQYWFSSKNTYMTSVMMSSWVSISNHREHKDVIGCIIINGGDKMVRSGVDMMNDNEHVVM